MLNCSMQNTPKVVEPKTWSLFSSHVSYFPNALLCGQENDKGKCGEAPIAVAPLAFAKGQENTVLTLSVGELSGLGGEGALSAFSTSRQSAGSSNCQWDQSWSE